MDMACHIARHVPPEMSGVIGSGSLLDLLEPGWRRELADGAPAVGLDVEAELLRAAAAALGEQARQLSVSEVAGNWPACVVVALARVAAADGSLWAAWHRMAKVRTTRQSADQWSRAFLSALGALRIALPCLPGTPPRDAVRAYMAAAASAVAAGTSQDAAGNGDALVVAERRPGVRLDPFGRGVLLTEEGGQRAQERSALPDEVTDPDDPLLVFDESGQPVGRVLPAGVVWVLYPVDKQLRSDVPPRVILASKPPLTWRGWRQEQLDLREASWLGLDATRQRTVRGRTKPVLRTGMPIPGVTASGRPVYAEPPDVLLPPGPGRWRVEARRGGSGAVLGSVTAPGDAWQPDSLWSRAPRPLLGELTITATAVDRPARPLQPVPADTPGLRRTVVVAEALGITSYPAPRLTSPRGLEPVEAVIAAPPGMTASPSALRYPADAATREITCVAGQVVQRLAVTPLHVRLRIDPEPGSGTAPTPWHYAGPLRLTPGDLWRGGALRLDLPGVAVLPPIALTATGDGRPARQAGEPVQVLAPTRQGRYPLRRILDTVTAIGDIELAITIDARTVTIASVTGTARAADPWAIA